MSTTKIDYSTRYAKQTEHNGVQMTLIGHWIDLAAYYRGSDGNAWAYQTGWSNRGNCDRFIEHLKAGKWRGVIH